MSEIKSTLDLVMERTRNMFQSDEDKQREKENEMAAQAKGICLGVQEGRIEVEEIPAMLEEQDESDRPILKKALIATLARSISLDGENTVIFESLESLTDESRAEDILGLKGLLAEYREQQETLATSARKKALLDLAEQGISGSAVQPNLEMLPEYYQEMNEMELSVQARLAKIMGKFA